MSRTDHRDSSAWRAADDLAQHIYRVSWKFMATDAALAQRMRSAAISIAAQIAEAFRWPTRGRRSRTLQNASAAAGELSYYLHFARRAGLLGETDIRRMSGLRHEVERQLEILLLELVGAGPVGPRPGGE